MLNIKIQIIGTLFYNYPSLSKIAISFSFRNFRNPLAWYSEYTLLLKSLCVFDSLNTKIVVDTWAYIKTYIFTIIPIIHHLTWVRNSWTWSTFQLLTSSLGGILRLIIMTRHCCHCYHHTINCSITATYLQPLSSAAAVTDCRQVTNDWSPHRTRSISQLSLRKNNCDSLLPWSVLVRYTHIQVLFIHYTTPPGL